MSERESTGVFRPSAVSLWVAIVSVLSIVGAGAVGLRPAVIASPAGAFAADSGADYHFFVSRRLFQLEREPPDPRIVAVGSSSTRLVFSEPERLEAALGERLGRSIPVENLAATGQTIWESGAILCRLPNEAPILAVLGVGPLPLGVGKEALAEIVAEPRLGFRSSFLDGEARRLGLEVPRTSGRWALDNRRFLLVRAVPWIENLLLRRRPEAIEVLDPDWARRMVTPRLLEALSTRARHATEMLDAHLATIARILEDCGSGSGRRVLLMENPLHPAFVDEQLGPGGYSSFRSRIVEFADRHGVEYWAPTIEAGFGADAYVDPTHLVAPAVDRLRPQVAARLSGSVFW